MKIPSFFPRQRIESFGTTLSLFKNRELVGGCLGMSSTPKHDLRSLLKTADLPSSNKPALPGNSFGGLTTSKKTTPDRVAPPQPTQHAQHAQNVMANSTLGPMLPAFIGLKTQITHDLENNLPKLLALNVSRREAIALYLDRLSGHAPGPAALNGSIDAGGGLRRWIDGPRSSAQSAAMQAYFEELALIVLGQALLLKAWSDRSLRSWSENDLKDLNWALHTALKPHIPLDRENWQIARQNIYSWYKPSQEIQHEIWKTLDTWRIAEEGPQFLETLFAQAQSVRPEHIDPAGYDFRFLKAIWKSMPLFGFDPKAASPLRKQWALFSPTLRDGALVRSGPNSVNCIGLESSSFQLMLAELLQLWWGQAPPPLWAVGNGLEVHTRDQLTLSLGSPKPSLLSRITEMEACDVAFVLEERSVRAQGRGAEAQRLRDQVDSHVYFKKLRSAATTLGDLQACVALSKLRPGGLLWWVREEPLQSTDGAEILGFLLEKSKLLCEWDLSEVHHSLPHVSTTRPLFPKYLYLFARDSRVEERLSHRPLRLTLQGQIRSHIELPLFLEDTFQAAARPIVPRGQWQLHLYTSPSTQKEWMDRWPDPTCQNTVRFVEKLRESSVQLASFTTVRTTPNGDASNGNHWSIHPSQHGFWIHPVYGSSSNDDRPRKLLTQPLPRPNRELSNTASGSGFLILVTDENMIPPLKQYLESETVRQWLDHHCERRGEKWILNEQDIRWIPVPKMLAQALGAGTHPSQSYALPLPPEWERMASQLADQPEVVRNTIAEIKKQTLLQEGSLDSMRPLLSEIFVRASRTLDSLRISHAPLFELFSEAGRVRWSRLIQILPKSEVTALTLHSRIELVGSMPAHLPISQIAQIKAPSPGILLATEAGINLRIHSDSARLLEMIMDQLEGLVSPTWSELTQYIKLPRRIELADATANDVLHAHGVQTQRLKQLSELLGDCTLV